ncbi:M48 family metallopeptidase [Omnitrophica bacterium]|nr:M48 family metallopeptidase [Candidatus Omnitrophota bacterium]
MSHDSSSTEKARVYQRIKQKLSLFHLAYSPLILCVFLFTPLSAVLRDRAYGLATNPWLAVAVYFAMFYLVLVLLDFPFSWYSGYKLEQRFELSNQSLGGWMKEFLKKTALSLLLSLALIEGLWTLIWKFPAHWWVLAWAGYAAISYLLGKIFPVVIVPLFYKYGQVDDEALKNRILALAARYQLPVGNIYSLNLSKTTKKANAAFMGLGRTKRVVLSDTLLENFDHDEIETVVAHELGHYKHRDIWKQLALGMTVSFFSFWIAFKVMDPSARALGLEGAGDIASLPLLFLLFYGISLVLMPLQNGFSRWVEHAADRFALQAFPKPEVFISCMEKLCRVNLADPAPNAVYEWFFYDHPSISRRIKMAQSYKERS